MIILFFVEYSVLEVFFVLVLFVKFLADFEKLFKSDCLNEFKYNKDLSIPS